LAAVGLVAVTVISSIAASQARSLARAEGERRQIAVQAKEDSDAARDRLEQTTARSLARALNPDVEVSAKVELTDPETEALWELAESPDERLRVRFLVEATRNPMSAFQLCSRSESALIAAVGLDSSRRDHAAELLLGRIRGRGLTVEHKTNLAIVALANEDSLDRSQKSALRPSSMPSSTAPLLARVFEADCPTPKGRFS
jgi:hypothetical protein